MTRVHLLPKYRRLVIFFLTGLLFLSLAGGSQAQTLESEVITDNQRDPLVLTWALDDERRPKAQIGSLPYREPELSSWALAVDNDILALTGRDQDYTYGINFTLSGRAATEGWYSLDRPLGWLDSLLGFEHLSPMGVHQHSIEAGFFGFTPDDIKTPAPRYGDRPYASLVYWSNSREQLDINHRVAWKSTLSVGLLGLDLVPDIQNETHSVLGGNQARGWQHQISDGGEPTARYSIARQEYLGRLFNNLEVKSTVQASVGYITEASWSLSLRGGHYQTDWSTFNPELVSYGEKSSYTSSRLSVDEHYFWGGVSIKARAYNAFLQGQFRHSEVSYHHSELRPLVVEAWAGYTLAFAGGYRISYVLRGHSSEIRRGPGDRDLLWGGIIIAKTFR